MKNITLSADETLIEAARARAREERTTLNEAFRHWLVSYASGRARVRAYRGLMRELRERVDTGGKHFTRDELNER